MSDTEDPVFAMIDLVDELVEGDRDNAIRVLNEEIDRVQARFSVLCALRDSLLPDVQVAEEASEQTSPAWEQAKSQLESQIVEYITEHGPSMPGDIAKAVGVHHTKIGRMANGSSPFVKNGKLIVLR